MRTKKLQRREGARVGNHGSSGRARKSSGQTEGQFGRDSKGRKGQYTAAGDSPLTKK